jgi:hypothetical protein
MSPFQEIHHRAQGGQDGRATEWLALVLALVAVCASVYLTPDTE